MRRQTIVFLIVLMTFSLGGIIFVQILWLSNSLDNRRDQLNQSVAQSMSEVAGDVKRLELNRFLVAITNLNDSLKKAQEVEGIERLFIQDNDVEDLNDPDDIIEGYEINPKLGIGYRRYSELLKKEIVNLNDQIADFSFSVEEDSLNQWSVSERQQRLLSEFYGDFAATLSLKSRLNEQQLTQLIDRQFELHGLPKDYEFAIIDNENGEATLMSEGFKIQEELISYPLLDNSINDTSRYILVISGFPVKKYLYSSIFGLAGMSLVFLLIILGTYLHAFFTVIRQEEISSIKTDFINNMTHEFKTPIATINLALDALSHDKIRQDPEKNLYYMQMIRDENKRMFTQVENVLQISRLNKTSLNIEKEKLNMSEIIQEARTHVELILQEAGGTMMLHLGALRDEVLGSESHLTNVIVNVMENAIKYAKVDQPPIIDVYTENVRKRLVIKIRDQGLGMSKQAQRKVFDNFYREHTGDVHNVKGHGLGLAYAKKIVEHHEGTIKITSTPGKGSTVIINLPTIN
jgi:two-component system phosphate regulon sensor histidine kinase PhoR